MSNYKKIYSADWGVISESPGYDGPLSRWIDEIEQIHNAYIKQLKARSVVIAPYIRCCGKIMVPVAIREKRKQTVAAVHGALADTEKSNGSAARTRHAVVYYIKTLDGDFIVSTEHALHLFWHKFRSGNFSTQLYSQMGEGADAWEYFMVNYETDGSNKIKESPVTEYDIRQLCFPAYMKKLASNSPHKEKISLTMLKIGKLISTKLDATDSLCKGTSTNRSRQTLLGNKENGTNVNPVVTYNAESAGNGGDNENVARDSESGSVARGKPVRVVDASKSAIRADSEIDASPALTTLRRLRTVVQKRQEGSTSDVYKIRYAVVEKKRRGSADGGRTSVNRKAPLALVENVKNEDTEKESTKSGESDDAHSGNIGGNDLKPVKTDEEDGQENRNGTKLKKNDASVVDENKNGSETKGKRKRLTEDLASHDSGRVETDVSSGSSSSDRRLQSGLPYRVTEKGASDVGLPLDKSNACIVRKQNDDFILPENISVFAAGAGTGTGTGEGSADATKNAHIKEELEGGTLSSRLGESSRTGPYLKRNKTVSPSGETLKENVISGGARTAHSYLNMEFDNPTSIVMLFKTQSTKTEVLDTSMGSRDCGVTPKVHSHTRLEYMAIVEKLLLMTYEFCIGIGVDYSKLSFIEAACFAEVLRTVEEYTQYTKKIFQESLNTGYVAVSDLNTPRYESIYLCKSVVVCSQSKEIRENLLKAADIAESLRVCRGTPLRLGEKEKDAGASAKSRETSSTRDSARRVVESISASVLHTIETLGGTFP